MMKMNERERLIKRTNAAIEAFKSQRLRWVTGRSQVKIDIDEQRYHTAVDKIMKDEVERHMLVLSIKEKGPLTISELSKATDLPPHQILRHIIALRKTGTISEAGEKGNEYLYAVQ